jgi:hypothetical protein
VLGQVEETDGLGADAIVRVLLDAGIFDVQESDVEQGGAEAIQKGGLRGGISCFGEVEDGDFLEGHVVCFLFFVF